MQNKIKSHQQSKAVFKANYKQIQIRQLAEILKLNIWAIDQNQYEKFNCSYVFQQMVQCFATCIHLNLHESPLIIKQIKHISFSNLQTLDLSENSIANIQPISQLNAINICALSLRGNNISRFASIGKVFYDGLRWLNIRQNPINELIVLTRTRFNSNKLDLLNLGTAKYQTSEMLILQDVCSIARYNSLNVDEICISQSRRILQPKTKQILKHKFTSLKI